MNMNEIPKKCPKCSSGLGLFEGCAAQLKNSQGEWENGGYVEISCSQRYAGCKETVFKGTVTNKEIDQIKKKIWG